MAVSALVGHCGDEVKSQLPGTVPASHVAIAGLHSWTEDAHPHLAEWGIESFSPDDLRTSSEALSSWLATTGCSKVAIHLDVDTVDADEVVLGLGAEPGGLTRAQVKHLVNELSVAADVVGLTIAEFVPRQVMQLLEMIDQMPLVGGTLAGDPTSPSRWPL